MKAIYILLTKSETILSRLVHLITADDYTHVSISFDQELQEMYSSSRKNGRTMFPAGPCRESLRGGYYERHQHIPCAVYKLTVSDETYDDVRWEVEWIMANSARCHFNILGLLLCRLNIPFHREKHFFCSQFVSEVLTRSRAVRLPKDTTLMRPSDYMRLPELVCMFRGRISEYI